MIESYYEEPSVKLYQEDCLNVMKEMPDESVDLVVTDPPYGYSFMGKDWDKAVVRVEIWKECLRVLKSGAFAFVMSAPRQDVLSKMICNLQEAGFDMGFTSIYWAYASGFPKASNIGKMIDKQECKKQLTEKLGRKPTKEEFEKVWKNFRKVIGTYQLPWRKENGVKGETWNLKSKKNQWLNNNSDITITSSVTSQAKVLDGSYGGFQPKPAVEITIVAMKPLSEKTYVDQALRNKKGITWFDDCRIPYDEKQPTGSGKVSQNVYGNYANDIDPPKTPITGRFPANLLVSDDVLNDGKVRKSPSGQVNRQPRKAQVFTDKNCGFKSENLTDSGFGDSGSFSRYFDLDKWAQKTFPFLIVPKASSKEKDKGLEGWEEKQWRGTYKDQSKMGILDLGNSPKLKAKNYHPTVKPIKLMSYLITLGSRPNDVILDPFVGSGTTLISCKMLNRKGIGIDNNKEYCDIAVARLKATMANLL